MTRLEAAKFLRKNNYISSAYFYSSETPFYAYIQVNGNKFQYCTSHFDNKISMKWNQVISFIKNNFSR